LLVDICSLRFKIVGNRHLCAIIYARFYPMTLLYTFMPSYCGEVHVCQLIERKDNSPRLILVNFTIHIRLQGAIVFVPSPEISYLTKYSMHYLVH